LPLVFLPSQRGDTLATVRYDGGTPHIYAYNLSVGQQLPLDMGLSISYVGSIGNDLMSYTEGNPTIPTSVTNGIPYWGPNIPACANNNPRGSICRVNPNWASMTLDQRIGLSWYNSLQAVVTKRLTHGLQFQSSYVWSKSLDETENMSGDSGLNTGCIVATYPANRRLAKGPSCFDQTNNFQANLLYHLPTMNRGGFLPKMANGWWTGNLISVLSGYPYTPVINTNRSRSEVLGGGVNPFYDYVNINTPASIAANPCTSAPGQPAAGKNPCAYTPIAFERGGVKTNNPAHWVNPAMFSLGPPGYLGDAGRNMLRGPGLVNWNFSIVKDTKLAEQINLQFRAEAFNLLNHTNYGVPNGVLFAGSSNSGPYAETALSTAGQITNTATTSRQLQFSLRLSF
jgi:hypothetical protein